MLGVRSFPFSLLFSSHPADRLPTAPTPFILIHRCRVYSSNTRAPVFRHNFSSEIIMRTFASLLIRWLIVAARRSSSSRPHMVEFSAVTQQAQQPLDRWTSSSARPAGPASDDALRPHHNSVNIEELYGISFIRERLAASARRQLPPEGRRPPVPRQVGSASSRATIALGENRWLFQQRNSTAHEGGATTEWLLFQQQHQQQPGAFLGGASFAPA